MCCFDNFHLLIKFLKIGSLPENIGYITSLTQLTLSGNNLTGIILIVYFSLI